MSTTTQNACGIAKVGQTEEVWEELVAQGLIPDSNKHLLKDLIRACPMCNGQKVYYDYLANKVCLSCGARFINGQLIEVQSV